MSYATRYSEYMENIDIIKINNKILIELLSKLEINSSILKQQITFLCYEWEEDNLIIFTNSKKKIVKDWLKLINQVSNNSISIVGDVFVLEDMKNIFPEEIGVNIMFKNSYGKTPYNYEGLSEVKKFSQMFIIGVAKGSRTLQELSDLSLPFQDVLPEGIETNFLLSIDEGIEDEGNYICLMIKT